MGCLWSKGETLQIGRVIASSGCRYLLDDIIIKHIFSLPLKFCLCFPKSSGVVIIILVLGLYFAPGGV